MQQRTAFASVGITAEKETSVKWGISSEQGGRVWADATSQECCCLGLLGTLQTEPISADFKGKSSILVPPENQHKQD